jgi:Putative quorum-sensing-regulated virulence factor
MTDLDPMPFGKHKGLSMKDVPRAYLDWLVKQEGFADKNKAMAAYIRGEKTEPSKEQVVNEDVGKKILDSAPPAFRTWWEVAYGTRCKNEAGVHYIGFLRVALEAWNFATNVATKGGDTPMGTITNPQLKSPAVPSNPAPRATTENTEHVNDDTPEF